MEDRRKNHRRRRFLSLLLTLTLLLTFMPAMAFADDAASGTGQSADISADGDLSDSELSDIEDQIAEEIMTADHEDGDTDAIDITEAGHSATGEVLAEDTDAQTDGTAELLSEKPDKSTAPAEITDSSESSAEAHDSNESAEAQVAAPEKISLFARGSEAAEADLNSLGSGAQGVLSAQELKAQETVPDSELFTLSASVSGTNLNVSGAIKDKYKDLIVFGELYIDGQTDACREKEILAGSFSTVIDFSKYDVGYHTLYVRFLFTDGENLYQDWRSRTRLARSITEAPNYNGRFEVYSKYVNYYPFNFGSNTGGDLYMEYSSNGGKTWKRSGYMRANAIEMYLTQGYKIKGLKAKKKYKTRIRYGTYTTYDTSRGGDGKTYFFGGPYRKTSSFKTGASKKPKIKSVKCKAIKVKYHKVRHYGYYTGVYLYTEKFYTYKVKVIIKLKKKPGTKGIFVNGKWLKGNKKKYTTTFTPYPNYSSKKPRGHVKFKVQIQSGQSKIYGGYSPLYKKTKKLS